MWSSATAARICHTVQPRAWKWQIHDSIPKSRGPAFRSGSTPGWGLQIFLRVSSSPSNPHQLLAKPEVQLGIWAVTSKSDCPAENPREILLWELQNQGSVRAVLPVTDFSECFYQFTLTADLNALSLSDITSSHPPRPRWPTLALRAAITRHIRHSHVACPLFLRPSPTPGSRPSRRREHLPPDRGKRGTAAGSHDRGRASGRRLRRCRRSWRGSAVTHGKWKWSSGHVFSGKGRSGEPPPPPPR